MKNESSQKQKQVKERDRRKTVNKLKREKGRDRDAEKISENEELIFVQEDEKMTSSGCKGATQGLLAIPKQGLIWIILFWPY